MKSPNFRSDIGFVVDDINYAYDDINYTLHDINYNMHDIGFGIAYKGLEMVAPPESVSLQLSLAYRPTPQWDPPILRAPLSLSSNLFLVFLDISFLLDQC
jgi:hypothetical protein